MERILSGDGNRSVDSGSLFLPSFVQFSMSFFFFTLILFLSAFICAKLLFYSSAVHFCSFACE